MAGESRKWIRGRCYGGNFGMFRRVFISFVMLPVIAVKRLFIFSSCHLVILSSFQLCILRRLLLLPLRTFRLFTQLYLLANYLDYSNTTFFNTPWATNHSLLSFLCTPGGFLFHSLSLLVASSFALFTSTAPNPFVFTNNTG